MPRFWFHVATYFVHDAIAFGDCQAWFRHIIVSSIYFPPLMMPHDALSSSPLQRRLISITAAAMSYFRIHHAVTIGLKWSGRQPPAAPHTAACINIIGRLGQQKSRKRLSADARVFISALKRSGYACLSGDYAAFYALWNEWQSALHFISPFISHQYRLPQGRHAPTPYCSLIFAYYFQLRHDI